MVKLFCFFVCCAAQSSLVVYFVSFCSYNPYKKLFVDWNAAMWGKSHRRHLSKGNAGQSSIKRVRFFSISWLVTSAVAVKERQAQTTAAPSSLALLAIARLQATSCLLSLLPFGSIQCSIFTLNQETTLPLSLLFHAKYTC